MNIGFERKGGREIKKINIYLKNAIMKPNTMHVNENKTKTKIWPGRCSGGSSTFSAVDDLSCILKLTKAEGEKITPQVGPLTSTVHCSTYVPRHNNKRKEK